MGAIPQVAIGEITGQVKADGLPVVILEDVDGNSLNGGPYQIVLSVCAAKKLVCVLVDAIDDQERRHPELVEELAVAEYDEDLIDEGDDEDDFDRTGRDCI
jgi:hypothetical protein